MLPRTKGSGMRQHTPTGDAGLSWLQRRILRQLHTWAIQIRASGDIRAQIVLTRLQEVATISNQRPDDARPV